MRKKYLLKDEGGFTLIEIIAVLVIMGILAAVAVPKFFDLQTKAREKAVYTAMSEMKVRVNQYFAEQLLSGTTWAGMNWATANGDIGTNLGDDFTVSNWDAVDISKTGGYLEMDITYTKITPNVVYTNQRIDLPRYDN